MKIHLRWRFVAADIDFPAIWHVTVFQRFEKMEEFDIVDNSVDTDTLLRVITGKSYPSSFSVWDELAKRVRGQA